VAGHRAVVSATWKTNRKVLKYWIFLELIYKLPIR
jgi:hypothetical protein